MPWVRAIGTSVPESFAQSDLRDAAQALVGDDPILDVFDNARILTRHLAMPLAWFVEPHGFKDRMDAYASSGLELAHAAARDALVAAGVGPGQVRAIVFVSTTGIATPSLDARLANLLRLPASVVRVPVWGLGCAGGAAGLARASELCEHVGGPVLLVALELCSLSFDIEAALGADAAQAESAGGTATVVSVRADKKSLVAASLFSDGCAAAVLVPDAWPEPRTSDVRVVGSASHLFPDSERVMGWDVADRSLDVVLSPRIPDIVRSEMADIVTQALAGMAAGPAGKPVVRPDEWILHPGGAKVLDAYRTALGLSDNDLRHATAVLRDHGNMSSPTVLFALRDAIAQGALEGGRTGLLAALGPGFASEVVLVRGR